LTFDRFSPALLTLWLLLVVSLNKDVFERRTSTGSGLLSVLDGGPKFWTNRLYKGKENTNLVASRCFKMIKTSLLVDVGRSKGRLSSSPESLCEI